MRILFMAPRVHTNLATLYRALESLGHTVRILVMAQGCTESRDEIDVVKLGHWHRQPWRKRMGSDPARVAIYGIPSVSSLYSNLATFRPDVVVCRGLTPIYILLALPYILLKSKLALYTQGPIVRSRGMFRKAKDRGILGLCRGRWFSPVWCRGSSEKAKGSSLPIAFIPFPVKVPEWAHVKDESQCPSVLNVISVGKFIERKNHERVIRAAARLQFVRLTVIGEVGNHDQQSELARLRKLAVSLGVEDRVILLSNVPHEQMQKYLHQADVYVQVSVAEPASVSHLEALAVGTPAVVSVDNGTADYVNDGLDGYIIGSAGETLEQRLKMLHLDRAALGAMSKAAVATARRDHDPEILAARLIALLRS